MTKAEVVAMLVGVVIWELLILGLALLISGRVSC